MRRAGAVFFLACGLILAQEAGAPEEHKGGVPEVNVLWKWANFAILFGILGYLAAKNAGPLLKQRSQEITDGLAAGERAKAEAETRAREVESRLGNLEGVVEQMRSKAREDREREADRIARETQAEIDRLHHQGNLEIESAGKQAAIEVRRFGARLAIELAETKVKARMTPEVQAALLNNFEKTVAAGGRR